MSIGKSDLQKLAANAWHRQKTVKTRLPRARTFDFRTQKDIDTAMKFICMAVVGSLLIIPLSAQAQARAGSYKIITLGKSGSHAKETGGEGTMTVDRMGKISGSVFSYSDSSTSPFRGSVNPTSGRGTMTDTKTRKVYDVIFRTSQRTFVEISYSKRASSSTGLIWGFR